MKNTRVQNETIDTWTYESSNYAYSVPHSEVWKESQDLIDLGEDLFPYWRHNQGGIADWLDMEALARIQEDSGLNADLLHPELQKYVEGKHYSYTYAERLQGWLSNVTRTLITNRDSRRAYWPIFHPIDALRADKMTRIPCTVGMHWMIRTIPGLPYDVLEGTLIQRSVDFEKFWLSDLWLFSVLTKALHTRLYIHEEDFNTLQCGNLNHYIISFHRFMEDGEEVY